MGAGAVNGLTLLLGLIAALCWGLAKVVQPGAGRVFNLVAVLLLVAALVVLMIQAFPAASS